MKYLTKISMLIVCNLHIDCLSDKSSQSLDSQILETDLSSIINEVKCRISIYYPEEVFVSFCKDKQQDSLIKVLISTDIMDVCNVNNQRTFGDFLNEQEMQNIRNYFSAASKHSRYDDFIRLIDPSNRLIYKESTFHIITRSFSMNQTLLEKLIAGFCLILRVVGCCLAAPCFCVSFILSFH